ncbi:hypothetical protein DL770_008967 [Monosporascus sp. CRB-9-2]|nr:hypothetical protein DL770_008967 [Monosporascus sp. CRB-9-2]
MPSTDAALNDTQALTTLVTGANTGIGEAVAKSLAADHGYHVIIGSCNLAAGQAVADTLTARGLKASAVHLDLVDESSIQVAAKSIVAAHNGRLDVLVNNARILLGTGPAAAGLTERQRFECTFAPNLFGQVGVAEAMWPLLRKAWCLDNRDVDEPRKRFLPRKNERQAPHSLQKEVCIVLGNRVRTQVGDTPRRRNI